MKISELTLRRLPLYLNYIRYLKEQGHAHVSAPLIEKHLGIHHTQIRKDLVITGLVGRAKIGHDIDTAISSIESFLGWNKNINAIIMGAGNLGTSLAGYSYLYLTGIDVVGIFDNNPAKIGTVVQGLPVFEEASLDYYAKILMPEIGIITTPEDAALTCANALVKVGIKAIWNFSAASLDLGDEIIIENTNLCSHLAVLSHKLKIKKQIDTMDKK